MMKPLSKSRHRYLLRHRTTEEWQAALQAIRNPETRTICCCIAWFDFFSEEDPPKPSPEILTQARHDWDYWLLIHRRIKTRPKQLEAALIRLGYHPELAEKRSKVVAE